MSEVVIKVENVSKQYRLGQVGTGTISHDLNRWWAKLQGKEDPNLKIGDVNDRTAKGNSDYVWSLQDINFEINKGDAVGIIGRNGAGKSTLLKILSKVTGPTTGNIKVKGRIASLLEVGTGFHPELTGRENIFLNGAILGMKRDEIKRKFDEIVDFSGVERYIDTPVKRYSSGMYVRLAFAVAAHLESEILIVDEVLAVGDAEFQKKCLGKMGDVSKGEGRTVLFVSHNMEAVQSFCNKGILLNEGTVFTRDTASNTILAYLKKLGTTNNIVSWNSHNSPGNEKIRWLHASMKNGKNELATLYRDDDIVFEFIVELEEFPNTSIDITYHLIDERNILIYVGSSGFSQTKALSKGRYSFKSKIPKNILNQGTYTISRLLAVANRGEVIHEIHDVVSVEILPTINKDQLGWMGAKEGILFLPNSEWSIAKKND